MRTHLDRLIEDYNRRIRIANTYEPLTIERTYSEEEKKEKEIESLREHISDITDKLSKSLQEMENKIANSAQKAEDIADKIENAYRTVLRVRHMSRNRIVSPKMYRRIMAYYKRHKKQKYYSKYKVDNELHNFLMRMGRYLEDLDKGVRREEVRDFSYDYHYYALPSIAIMISGRLQEVLGYLSSAIKEAAHIIEIVLHVLVELFPKILHSIPFLSTIMPHFLAACLIAFLAGSLLIIIAYAIHPERKSKFKILIDKIKINLGIRKSYIHAAYLIYVYKLYDILSTISSYIIEVFKLIQSGKDVDEEKTAEKLEKKAEKSAHVVGLKDKALGHLADKIKFKIFEEAKDKLKTSDETISIDLENHKKLLDSIKKGNNEISVCSYKFAVSSDAMKKLVEYYGDKFQGGGKWIEVTLEYTGGAYHKSANPLQKIDISGFSGDAKEASNFIGAVLAISDKLAIDRIGEQEFESPLMIIDLQKLKLLSYKSTPFIDKLTGSVKKLATWVKKLITGKAKEKGELDPADLGNLMFEAYMSINGIKSVEMKEKQIQTEEKEEAVDKTEEKE